MDRPPPIDWPVPDAFPALGPAEVHVWCAWLDAPGVDGPHALATLSAEEKTRAAAFHFAADRRRYVASHVMVREVLAGYLAAESAAKVGVGFHTDAAAVAATIAGVETGDHPVIRAAGLQFLKGPHGKPALAGDALQFNLSHSGALALLAVARDQAVGVDLEQRWEMPDLAIMEERMFTPAALKRQQLLAPGLRLRGFYRRWTQLEAAGKCRGTGLELEKKMTGDEYVAPADPAEGFTGCLACERKPAQIGFFRYLKEVSSALPETTASPSLTLPGLPHRLEGLAPLSFS